MASSRSLGILSLNLVAEIGGFKQGMDQAARIADKNAKAIEHSLEGIKRFGETALAAFGFEASIRGFLDLGKTVIETGDTLAKAATKSGLSGEAISQLAYAAKLADVGLGSLSDSLKKMQVALSTAATGGKEQNEALKALGLTVSQLKGLAPDKQFELLGDRISQLKDPADKARAAVALFGKAGADLLPLFAEGAEGIRKARAEAEGLGQSFSTEQLKTFEEANDNITRLTANFNTLATTLVGPVASAFNEVFARLNHLHSGDELQRITEEFKAVKDLDAMSGKLPALIVGLKDVTSGLYTESGRATVLDQLATRMDELRDNAKKLKSDLDFSEWLAGSSKAIGFEEADKQQKLLDLAKKYATETAIPFTGAAAYQETIRKIKLAQDQGVLNEQDAADRKKAAWKKYIDYVEKQAAEDYKLAQFRDQQAKLPDFSAVANGSVKASSYFQDLVDPQQLEDARTQTDDFLKEITADTDNTMKEMSRVINDSLSHLSDGAEAFDYSMKSAFDDMLQTGTFSARNLALTFVEELSRKEIFKAIDRISEALDEAFQPAGKTGLSSLFPFLADAIGGIFGGSWSSKIAGNTNAYINSQLGSIEPLTIGMPHAAGGPVSAGIGYPVGERGPELFVPKMPGTIIPNNKLGGNPVNINYSFNGTGLSQDQIFQLMQRNNADMSRNIREMKRRGDL